VTWADVVAVPLWIGLVMGVGYCAVWWVARLRRKRQRPPVRQFRPSDYDQWRRE